MAITLTATPGAADANSFPSLEEAEAYLETRLHTEAWDAAAGDDEKKAALIWATRLVASTCWTGTIASDAQALPWPRTGMTDRFGRVIAEDAVPDPLKWAVIELALLLLTTDRTQESEAGAAGITKIKAGPVELDFKSEITTETIPRGIWNLLAPSWLCENTAAPPFTFEAV